VAFPIAVRHAVYPKCDRSESHSRKQKVHEVSEHFSFLSAALPRLAQDRLQYFLCLEYSRLAVNSFPQMGHTAVLEDFQFSGLGCLFFQANLQASEQKRFRLPFGFWYTGFPHSGQKPDGSDSMNSRTVSADNPGIISSNFRPPFIPRSHVAPYSCFAEIRRQIADFISKYTRNGFA
jgi:hypothetical protein